MKFMRCRISYIQIKISIGIIFLIGFILAVVAGVKQETKVMFFLVASFGLAMLLLLYGLRNFDEYVTVDEKGITCEKKGEILWQYAWFEIAYLLIGAENRSPGVHIILKVDCQDKRFYPQPKGSFQLTKASREALNSYCRKEKDKYMILSDGEA